MEEQMEVCAAVAKNLHFAFLLTSRFNWSSKGSWTESQDQWRGQDHRLQKQMITSCEFFSNTCESTDNEEYNFPN